MVKSLAGNWDLVLLQRTVFGFRKPQRLDPVFIDVISDEFPSLSLFPVRRLVKEVNACK